MRELLARLDPSQTPSRRFLAVIGPSGSGKSSLVRAGLLPELQKDGLPGSSQWQREIITPGSTPKAELVRAIARHPDRQPYVLFIDQFEELFTLCPREEEQREFLALLNQEATDPNRETRVVIAMRGDFLDRCARYQESADLINQTQPTTFVVTPLTDAQLAARLEEVIVKPAAMHGVSFAPGLVWQIISEVLDQLGAMPLLQFALTELWETCIPDPHAAPELTWDGYRTIGGVKGALQRRADTFYQGLTQSDRAFLPQLLLQLVQIGDEGELTRRHAHWEDLRQLASHEQLDRLISQMTDQRFLVAGEDTIEVAHESLLTEAPLIRNWIEENRERIRLRDRFERNCREWHEQGKSPDYLLNRGRLDAVEDWIAKDQPALSDKETEFLQQSRELRDREVSELKRLNAAANDKLKLEKQRTRLAIASLLSITVLSIFGAVQWRTADRNQVEALLTASRAEFDKNRDSLDTMIVAVQAGQALQRSIWFRNNPDLQARAMEALAAANNWVRERNRWQAHANNINSVVFSPDLDPANQILATGGGDKVIKLWRRDGTELGTLTGHKDDITTIDFSADGQTIVTADYSGVIKRWQRNGTPLDDPKHPNLSKAPTVWSLSVSPTDGAIAAAYGDGTIALWNQQGKFQNAWKGHQKPIYSVQFSPNGQTISTASEDGTIKLWTRSGSSPIATLSGHKAMVYSAKFSPDGQKLVSASQDQTAIVWDRTTGKPLATLKGHTSDVFDAVFSPDGKTLATASRDNTIKLWNLQGRLLSTLQGHTDRINRLSFNRDGTLFASVSNDKTVRLWQPKQSGVLPIQHSNRVSRISFKPDGKQLVSVDEFTHTILLWNRNGDYLQQWKQPKRISDVNFSPDGQRLAISDRAGNISLQLLTAQSPQPLGKHEAAMSVNFDPSGTTIVSAGFDQTIKLWSVNGNFIRSIPNNLPLYYARFSPDGATIGAALEDGTAKLWQRDGTLKATLKGHQPNASALSISFSPDGQQLTTASVDGTAILWSATGKLIRQLKGHTARVVGAEFQPPGGQIIATASDDRSIKLWTRNGQLTTTLVGHRQPINSIRFSPDGKLLATASDDGTVLLWQVENFTFKDLMQRGCTNLADYFKSNQVNFCSK